MFGWFKRRNRPERREDNELTFFITKEQEVLIRLTFRDGANRDDVVNFTRFVDFLSQGKLFTAIQEAAKRENSAEGRALNMLLDQLHFHTDPNHTPIVDASEVFGGRHSHEE